MSRQFMITPGDRFEFGFPDFAETIFRGVRPAIQLAYTDSHLANEMLGAGIGAMPFSNISARAWKAFSPLKG
jgi:hypothetical protein